MKSLAVSQSTSVQADSTSRLFNNTIKLSMPLASLAVAIAAANYAPVASAQVEYTDNMRFLEEVVVTARRKEESLQDIPVAVTALDSEFLREQNIVDLNDLGTRVPSFRVSTGGTSTNEPVLSIRGQRPTDSSISLDAAIPVYFADVVMTPSTATNLAMYDLQSVQVLKGPQGTLFGRNSTGGALLLTPKKPGTELGGYVEVEAGEFDLIKTEGAVDIPISDSLQVRLAGRMLQRDGYQQNKADNGLDDPWDEDSKGARVSINYEQGKFSNLLMVAYDENEMIGRVPVPTAFNGSVSLGKLTNALFNYAGQIDDALEWQQAHDADEIQYDAEAPDEVENTIVSNISEYEINDSLTVKNIFGYRKMEWNRSNDADGTALPIFGAQTQGEGFVTTDMPLIDTESEQFSNEIQLLGSAFDDRLDWLVGAYWYEMKGSQRGDTQVLGPNPGSIPLLDPSLIGVIPQLPNMAAYQAYYQTYLISQQGMFQSAPAGEVNNEAYGLFAEGTYTFNDSWSMTLGLRQSWDTREVTVRNYGGLGGPGSPYYQCSVTDEDGISLVSQGLPCERTEDEDYSSPSWRASVNYTPVDGHLLYGSVSTGYRAGGFNMRGNNNETLQPFDEETVVTYEFGHKADWHLGSVPMRTNLALYWQDYKDIQKTQSVITDSGFGTATVNAGKATIKGAEFDITASVTENLILSLAYSYVDAGYDEWDSAQTWTSPLGQRQQVIVNLEDSNFVYMPEQTLTASINYSLPLDDSLGEMSLMASVYWQDEMNTDETSVVYAQQAAFEGWSSDDLATAQKTAEADSYSVVNLRFDWRNVMGSNFDFATYVNNATDEEYVVGGLNVLDSLGWAAFTYGAPRTIGASLRYQF